MVLNGLIVVYVCKELEYDGNFLIFLNSINFENFMYYKEFVDENIGDLILEVFCEIELLFLYIYWWFMDVMKVFLINFFWYIECYMISKCFDCFYCSSVNL